jgi:hypothetical protein
MLGLMTCQARPDQNGANFGAFYYTKIGVKNGGFLTFCLQSFGYLRNFAMQLRDKRAVSERAQKLNKTN